MRIPPKKLFGMTVALLERYGVPSHNAQLQAELLIEAELPGFPSHGLQRLPRLLSRIGGAVPGDGARAHRAAAMEAGIDLPDVLYSDLKALEAA